MAQDYRPRQCRTSGGGRNAQASGGTDAGQSFVEVTITRQLNADDATVVVQSSTNLTSWSSTGWVLQSSAPGANGAATETWRRNDVPGEGRLYVQGLSTQR